MKRFSIFFLLPVFAGFLIFNGCTSDKSASSAGRSAIDTSASEADSMTKTALSEANDILSEDNGEVVGTKGGITVSYFDKSPDFPDAKLTQLSPTNGETASQGKILFRFKVDNFQLTQQTMDASMKDCANSAQGQHIHHILNNQPYTAHYTDTFTKTLAPGHYISLAFLSRSYHESIKHKNAYVLEQFDIAGKNAKTDLSGPLMFYSRPKGDYAGKDTKKILLDFYLVNTELSLKGNKVRATINGNEFMLDRWVPYAVTGLPMGENTFKLELVDSKGKVIPGPYNTVERKINLKP